MTHIRTVALELLRHGPPHNQLLSPLTPYLGFCGNYGAGSINVPYEHAEFLSRLKMLRYQDPATKAARRYQDHHLANTAVAVQRERIEETAEKMADILQSIPGLVSELSVGPDGDNVLTHLRLIISHSELALLPFEMAKVPEGCKGGRGNWLSLQTHAPVCITRQVRGVNGDRACWNRTPRILFAFAATSDMDSLVQAHTTALTKSILPWLHHFDDSNPQQMEQAFAKHLTILPNATVETIEEACSKGGYTHVHILAHGALDKNRQGNHYGISLCRRRGSQSQQGAFETVSGEQLAMALGSMRVSCLESGGRLGGEHPLVVTVASCDSANQGDVIYDGASFAHELHQSGIPFVVASQFPLSFAGSVVMAQELYQKLMCGVDPRVAVHALRGKLAALNDPGVHDWAALVVYAALPDDLNSRLVEYRYLRAKEAIGASMSHVDAKIDKISQATGQQVELSNIQSLMKHVDKAIERLPNDSDYLTEAIGLRGTVNKRKAEAYFRIAAQAQKLGQDPQSYLKQCFLLLEKSRSYYLDASYETLKATDKLLRKKRELHWPLTQYLSLSLIFEGTLDDQLWQAALFSIEIELKSESKTNQVWAGWSQVELHLIRAASSRGAIREKSASLAEELTDKMVKEAHQNEFATYSSRRQLQRYIRWWGDELFIDGCGNGAKQALTEAKRLAELLIDKLPSVDTAAL